MSDEGKKSNESSEDYNAENDTRAVADKDTTKQTLKPKYARSIGNAAMTPTGTISIPAKREVTITVTNEELPESVVKIDLSRNDINHEEKIKDVNVLLRLDYDGANPEGIDGGRITRMTLTKGEVGEEEILAHFDNGDWVQKPETPLEIQVMMKAKKEHNGLEMPEIKAAFDQALKNKIKP